MLLVGHAVREWNGCARRVLTRLGRKPSYIRVRQLQRVAIDEQFDGHLHPVPVRAFRRLAGWVGSRGERALDSSNPFKGFTPPEPGKLRRGFLYLSPCSASGFGH